MLRVFIDFILVVWVLYDNFICSGNISKYCACGLTLAGLRLQDNVRRAMPAESGDAGYACIAPVCLSGAGFAWLQYTRSAVPVTHCKKKSAPKGAPYFIAYFYNAAIVAGPGFFSS